MRKFLFSSCLRPRHPSLSCCCMLRLPSDRSLHCCLLRMVRLTFHGLSHRLLSCFPCSRIPAFPTLLSDGVTDSSWLVSGCHSSSLSCQRMLCSPSPIFSLPVSILVSLPPSLLCWPSLLAPLFLSFFFLASMSSCVYLSTACVFTVFT